MKKNKSTKASKNKTKKAELLISEPPEEFKDQQKMEQLEKEETPLPESLPTMSPEIPDQEGMPLPPELPQIQQQQIDPRMLQQMQQQQQQQNPQQQQLVSMLANLLLKDQQPSFEQQLANRFAGALGNKLGDAIVGSLQINLDQSKFQKIINSEKVENSESEDHYKEEDWGV